MLTRQLVPALTALALLGGIAAGTSARAQSPTVVIAPSAPPPVRVETVPPPPTVADQTEYWQPGHWMWSGANWAWMPGQYVVRPAPQAVWQPGHWLQQPTGSYLWIDGHWEG